MKSTQIPGLLRSSPKRVLDYVTSLKVVKITKHRLSPYMDKRGREIPAVAEPENNSPKPATSIAIHVPKYMDKKSGYRKGELTPEEKRQLYLAKNRKKGVLLTAEQKRVLTKERNRLWRAARKQEEEEWKLRELERG